MKIISPKNICEHFPYYEDMAHLAKIFHHKIVLKDGVIRWQENKLVRYLTGDYGGCEFHTPPQWTGMMHNQIHNGAVDLNGLAVARSKRIFTLEEYMKFYMGMGYSLSGFGDIFGQSEVTEYGLEYIEQPPENHNFDEEYWETPIEYIRKKYKNKKAYV